MTTSVDEFIRRAAAQAEDGKHEFFQIIAPFNLPIAAIARESGIGAQQFLDWRSRKKPVPKKHESTLFNMASGIVAGLQDIIGEAALERPDLVGTRGFRHFIDNVRRAKEILMLWGQRLDAEEKEGQGDESK